MPLIIHGNEDRRSHTNTGVNMSIHDNLEEREEKIADQIDSKYVYRVPLKFFWNLCKINFPTKIDLKILCTLQTNMKQLFESKKRWLVLARQTCKLFLLEPPIYNMNRFCLQRILSSSLKRQCSYQKF